MEAEQEVWIMSCIRSSIFLWKNEPIPFLVFPNLTAHSIRSLEGSVCVEHQSTFWQETLYTQLDGNLSHDPFQREKAVSIHLGQNFALEVHFWKPMFSLLLAPASARWAWHPSSLSWTFCISHETAERLAPLLLHAPKIQQRAALALHDGSVL